MTKNALRLAVPLSLPHMHSDAQASMAAAFESNWIAQVGPLVDAFEDEMAVFIGVPQTLATHSGTAAIHLAMALCDVQPGDTVFCSSLTFIASANPITYRNATPVFIDSDPETWCMSPLALERALADAAREGKLPKAIVVVNLYGQSADMDPILALADAYGVPVVEDAAESLGATYKGKASGTLGFAGIYSFAGNKIITTSTGGMLVSPHRGVIDRARFLGAHHARDPLCSTDHSETGFNYRMSNVLGGLGRSQLRVLPERVDARRAVFERYVAMLEKQSYIEWMPEASYGRSTRWLSAMLLDPRSGLSAPELIGALATESIEARRVFRPLHTQPVFRGSKFYAHDDASVSQSVCERLFEHGVCLPSSSTLSVEDQERVVDTIVRFLCRGHPRLPNPLAAENTQAPAIARRPARIPA